MGNVNDSAAWQLGYEAYMQGKEITDNIFYFMSPMSSRNMIEWNYGYLDAQIEVEGIESVAVVSELAAK